MKALGFHKKNHVSVDNVNDPILEKKDDIKKTANSETFNLKKYRCSSRN